MLGQWSQSEVDGRFVALTAVCSTHGCVQLCEDAKAVRVSATDATVCSPASVCVSCRWHSACSHRHDSEWHWNHMLIRNAELSIARGSKLCSHVWWVMNERVRGMRVGVVAGDVAVLCILTVWFWVHKFIISLIAEMLVALFILWCNGALCAVKFCKLVCWNLLDFLRLERSKSPIYSFVMSLNHNQTPHILSKCR